MNETLPDAPEYVPDEMRVPTLIPKDKERQEVASMTPAQSRVNAVSNVLQKAYERAGTLELSPEQSAALMAPFPDEAFQRGAGGNAQLIYIEHAHLRDRLNSVLGLGQWAIVRMRPHWAEEFEFYSKTKSATHKGTRIFAECALIVKGCFVAEAIGSMDYFPNQATNFADAAKGAVTSAFRRCASDFGVGLQAWKKDFCTGWFERQRQGQRPATQSSAKPAPTPKVYQVKPADPMVATEKTRTWMLDNLKQFAPQDLIRFAIDEGIMFSGEDLQDWPLGKVPNTNAALSDLIRKIEDWQALNAEAAGEPPVDQSESWWDTVISVPRAGTKRAEYLANPDTIRSLYDAMKAGDEKAKARLWGMAHEWAPAARTDSNGKVWQPRPEDHDCRTALDQFLEWEESKKELQEEHF